VGPGALPPRRGRSRRADVLTRGALFAPALLGALALIASLPVLIAALTGPAQQALVAATIGGVLALLGQLVVQYIREVLERLRYEDHRYRQEMGMIAALLMELADAQIVFSSNPTHETYRSASTEMWNATRLRLGEFWRPEKVFRLGVVYNEIKSTNEVLGVAERLSAGYSQELADAQLKCAEEIERAIKEVGAEPIRAE